MNDFWIILTGVLVAVNCGLLGTFLVLRRMAMIGDAISHAVLPGIAVAYLVSQSRGSVVMLIGAAVVGVVTTFLIEWISRRIRVQEDASIGMVFTFLFAIGVILISGFAGNIDLDQDCVLYGEIAYVPFDVWLVGDHQLGPVPVWILGGNLLLILGLVVAGFRGWFITSFDTAYAVALGISATLWHYALMSAVSMTVVFSFNSVGAILVVAFLVVPPAAAYLLSKRLKTMLWLSALFGALSAIGGYFLADWWQASISGSMAIAAGIIFTAVFIWKGYLTKWWLKRKFESLKAL